MVLMAARGMPTTLDLVEKILKVEEVK